MLVVLMRERRRRHDGERNCKYLAAAEISHLLPL
jgi:hypothetical protein